MRPGSRGATGREDESFGAPEVNKYYTAHAQTERYAHTLRSPSPEGRGGQGVRTTCNGGVADYAGRCYDTQHESCISYRSPARGDARPRRPSLGRHGPPDARHGHGRRDPARLVRVLRGPVGGDDGGDDA